MTIFGQPQIHQPTDQRNLSPKNERAQKLGGARFSPILHLVQLSRELGLRLSQHSPQPLFSIAEKIGPLAEFHLSPKVRFLQIAILSSTPPDFF
jgi:hypothetical protein